MLGEGPLRIAGRTSRRFFVGAIVAALASTVSRGGVFAFDKQTCAVAYENAQQLRGKLKLRRARDQLLICGHSTCPAVVTKDCNAWLDEVETELTSVIFRVKDSRGQDVTDVRVTMDDEHLRDRLDGVPLFLDPGQHTFSFETPTASQQIRQMLRKGDRDRTIDIVLRTRQEDAAAKPETAIDLDRGDAGVWGGRSADARPDEATSEAKPPIEIQLAEPGGHGPPGPGTYVAAGVGAVALTTFAYFGLSASSDAETLRKECAPSCASERVDAIRNKLVVANVSLGIGIAALGVGGALWLLQGAPAPKTASGLHFDVIPLGAGQGAQVVTTFTAP
jgi:hypothetical protein